MPDPSPNPTRDVLILGAHSDIAVALATAYARQGCRLLLAARNPDRLDALVRELASMSGQAATPLAFDALAFDDHPGFLDALPRLPDTVVCVFGYLGDQERAERDFDETRRIIESNYLGAVSVLNGVAERMQLRGSGTIIGIGSVAGDRGRQANYIYGSAKAGFAAYLSGLRQRLMRFGVHVMTVKPGFVRTRMTEGRPLPARLTATPDQVATDIVRAQARGTNVLYTLWIWRYVMWVIRALPEVLFKRTNL